jgi:hypothetical protein
MAWQISSEVWNFLDQSRNYILSMCCCVGSTVNVGIDPFDDQSDVPALPAC